MEIDEIITRAIPAEDCPIKNAGAMHRREELKKRLIEFTGEKLKIINPRAGISDSGEVFVAGTPGPGLHLPFDPGVQGVFKPNLEYK